MRKTRPIPLPYMREVRPVAADNPLVADDEEIVLEVNDDGVGIDTADTTRAVQAGHVGLAMARRRVEHAGARFEIQTRRDGGSHSRVVPATSN